MPEATDQVEVHYTGKLIDGTVFDSSVDRGVPATFGVTQVIPGWVEALQLMKAGSKWRLFIPSNLAYGPNGAPGSPIGPNSTPHFRRRASQSYRQMRFNALMLRVLAAAALTTVALCAYASPDNSTVVRAEAEISQAEADSCAAAFATVMARYLKPEIAKQFNPDDSISDFVKGVAHAFETKNSRTPYFLGVRSGLAMIDRLEQMQQMGFPHIGGGFYRPAHPGPGIKGDGIR